MKIVSSIVERKDVRMICAPPPHTAQFELIHRVNEEGGRAGERARLLVPTRQALEEAVGGRMANSLLTTKSDTAMPDAFLFDRGFLSEYLSTSPTPTAVPGTYNVQRPYSDEFGYFSSDGMFASSLTRYMLPPPDAKEGTFPGFPVYELVSGFHDLLHGTFNFFTEHCAPLNLDASEEHAEPMLFMCAFHEPDRGVFVEAAQCYTGERAKERFQQFRERCGGSSMNNVDFSALRIKLNRWNLYDVILKALSQNIPFQKRNQATSLARQLMRLITQEKAELQVTRHIRLVAAEIRSLANKMETLHTGSPTTGEPLFGGQPPIKYTPEGVAEAFSRHEKAPPPSRARKNRPTGRAQANPRGAHRGPDPEDTMVERAFRQHLLPQEATQALHGLLMRSKAIREQAGGSPFDPPPGMENPPSPPHGTRGTRILRLMLEHDYEWAPILRRIAGFIYTPAFPRHYLPVVVQTQVVHQTRAQRKVRVAPV